MSGQVEQRTESEAKFLLTDPAREMPELLALLREAGLSISEPSRHRQVDRYFDTAGWDLYRAGWAYRFRDASEKKSVDLKSLSTTIDGADGVHQRQEVEVTVERFPRAPSRTTLAKAPLAGELSVLVGNGEATLKELFRVSTKRTTYRVSDALIDLTVCADATEVRVGRAASSVHPLHFHELELELENGDPKRLHQLANRVRNKLHLLPARMSKFERGLYTAELLPIDEGNGRGRTTFGPKDPAILLAHHYLRGQYAALVANEPVAYEGLHPEGVHQMRVASRRFRVGLRVFRKLLPRRETKHFLKEIKWITQTLGDVRDLDVFRDAIRRDAEAAQADVSCFQRHLDLEWKAARRDLVRSLSGSRFVRFKNDFAAFLEHGFWEREARRKGAWKTRKLAKKIIGPALQTFLAEGRLIESSSDDDRLHALRLHGKRIRYRLELFEPVLGGNLEGLMKASRALQQYLGDHQDACVALLRIDAFRRTAELKEPERKNLEKLRSLLNRRRRKLRKAFPVIWKAFADRADRKGLRKRLGAT